MLTVLIGVVVLVGIYALIKAGDWFGDQAASGLEQVGGRVIAPLTANARATSEAVIVLTGDPSEVLARLQASGKLGAGSSVQTAGGTSVTLSPVEKKGQSGLRCAWSVDGTERTDRTVVLAEMLKLLRPIDETARLL